MSTTYDDMLAQATEDMLTDISEVQPYKDKVWVVVSRHPGSVGADAVRLFHRAEDAHEYSDSLYHYNMFKSEVN